MRKSCVPILLLVCLLGPGCSFAQNVCRNIVAEVRYVRDERVIRKRAYRYARQAWEAMTKRYGENFCDAYEDGFIEGFVDYIVYGGCSSGCGDSPVVPAVPPLRYRHARNMTPQGYRSMEEWFVGFQHGAATAQASGLRNLVVVPVFNPPFLGQELQARPTQTDRPPETPDGTLPPPQPLGDTGGAAPIPGTSGAGAAGTVPGGVPGAVPGVVPGAPRGAPVPPLPIPPPGGRPAGPPPGNPPAGQPQRPPQ
jgi:hypothetical protein